MSTVTTAITFMEFDCRLCAKTLGVNCIRAITSRTRCAVSGRTFGLSLITLDTVADETPASLAMS